jgi:transcriptional regulator with XRE-family HTH domain
MRQDLGQILEKAVRQSGYPITKLAKRIGYTRQHVYNLFAQQQVDLQLLDEIGKIINVDFGDKVKSLKKYSSNETQETNTHNIADKEDFKNKYYALLEEHNKLLKEYKILVKNKLVDYLKKVK